MFTDAQFKVLTELRRRAAQQAFLQHTEFDALCQQHKIGEDGGQTREYFLDLLDKLGVLIYFKNLPFLGEHVLNPRWLTYGVYTVMYANHARVTLTEIVTLLSKEVVRDEQGQELSYPPDKCGVIADAMVAFNLCYRLQPHSANRIIIPCLLETDQPPGLKQANFDKTRALAYKIAFTGFVPRHVMSEMIVERNEEIEKELVWQYGVLLRHRELNARAWVQVDYQARELTIWAEGADARDYLGLLRDNLKGILSRLTMKYAELIRLPASALIDGGLVPDGEDWADYAQIELHRKKNRASFLSGTREYDLGKIVGLYVPTAQQTMHVEIHGGQQNFNQTGVKMAGDKTINIHGGTVHGSVVNADKVDNSFNTTNHNANPELAALLQQLLAEIQNLNSKVPAAQVTVMMEDAQQLLAETQRPEPRQHWYQASLTGIVNAAQKLGEVGGPLLELAGQLKTELGL